MRRSRPDRSTTLPEGPSSDSRTSTDELRLNYRISVRAPGSRHGQLWGPEGGVPDAGHTQDVYQIRMMTGPGEPMFLILVHEQEVVSWAPFPGCAVEGFCPMRRGKSMW